MIHDSSRWTGQSAPPALTLRTVFKRKTTVRPSHPTDPGQGIVFFSAADVGGLCVENLTLNRPRTDEVLIGGINLHLKPGDRLALTGPSGCGKSTLRSALAGYRFFGHGTVSVSSAMSRLNLPQSPFVPPLPLNEILAFGSSKTFSHAEMADALTKVGLARHIPLLSRPANAGGEPDGLKLARELSGGEKQRLRFASVLLQKPGLLVMDEATAGLDQKAAAELYGIVCATLPKETIIISVIHDMQLLSFHTLHGSIENHTLTVTPIKEISRAPEMLSRPGL